MPDHPEHVVVVGAGLGGVRVIEQLRARGYAGRITLVGAERHEPYDRPPLSKQILNRDWEPDRATLRNRSALRALEVSLRLGVQAVGLNGTMVELADGGHIVGDAVVIATGAAPRSLPGQPDGIAALRTLDDALALRDALDSARSLLVVGAGFIGAEVASGARRRGVEVTVLEAMPVPCERVLGRSGGGLAARLFTDAGVDLRCGSRIARFADRHTAELSDGRTVSADAVLVAVGAAPDLGWLHTAGLGKGDVLACDRNGRVLGTDGVWALGDVAAWQDVGRGQFHRHEHWTSVVDQAVIVGSDILGAQRPAPTVPYVWSDQFGLKIQVLGRTDLADEVIALHGAGLTAGPVRGTILAYLVNGTLAGAVGFGAPARMVRYRTLVAEGADRAAVLAFAESGASVG
ncbi:NAD(P)/FAD-dependent oxidoreductase [Streptomyces fuscichromogenes]|uniref:Ferredoxin reductase n=1 Tax=Streptomyces fuscichromogenes TaxID=1324013 RepID=A0A917X9S7_9ACTN|nr:FAD-dependent oxidoreductase [Streptomyces fuscichromogenes]GGM98306.1 ferredoxin reductase [Streptomyces fuscichromogenes]